MIKTEEPATIKEIAAALGKSTRTIRRYHASKAINTFQLGTNTSPILMARVELRKLVRRGKR